MKPEVDQILGLSTAQLMSQVVPLLPNSYAIGSTSLLGIMMTFAAQEYERGADIRAAENADMRALFHDEVKPRLATQPGVGAYNQEI